MVNPGTNGSTNKYKFEIDDDLLHSMQTGKFNEETHSFNIFHVNNAVLMTVPQVSLYVLYDGQHTVIEVPKDYHTEYFGQCF